jgi:hypothetical protein
MCEQNETAEKCEQRKGGASRSQLVEDSRQRGTERGEVAGLQDRGPPMRQHVARHERGRRQTGDGEQAELRESLEA